MLEDEEEDEDGFDIEGGPEPAVAVGGLDVEVLELVEAVAEGTLAGMEMLWMLPWDWTWEWQLV